MWQRDHLLIVLDCSHTLVVLWPSLGQKMKCKALFTVYAHFQQQSYCSTCAGSK